MANMIWCNKCNSVVWAWDDYPSGNIGGLVNEFGLHCPNCNCDQCFDSWGFDKFDDVAKSVRLLIPNEPIYDKWSIMRAIAKHRNKIWIPSCDNRWREGSYKL